MPRTSSSRRSHAASCRPSAPRRSTSTASTSRGTRRWSAGSSRSWSMSRRSTRPSRSSSGIRELYEEHHQVKISDEALQRRGRTGVRYVTDRFMPDKAIDLIDEAGSRVRMRNASAPPEIKEAQLRSGGGHRQRKDEAIAGQDYEAAARLRDEEAQGKERDRAAARRLARRAVEGDAGRHRRGHRPGRLHVDRHPGHPHQRRRIRAPAEYGRGHPRALIGQEEAIATIARRCGGRAPDSRIRSGRSAPSSSWARPASARR